MKNLISELTNKWTYSWNSRNIFAWTCLFLNVGINDRKGNWRFTRSPSILTMCWCHKEMPIASNRWHFPCSFKKGWIAYSLPAIKRIQTLDISYFSDRIFVLFFWVRNMFNVHGEKRCKGKKMTWRLDSVRFENIFS